MMCKKKKHNHNRWALILLYSLSGCKTMFSTLTSFREKQFSNFFPRARLSSNWNANNFSCILFSNTNYPLIIIQHEFLIAWWLTWISDKIEWWSKKKSQVQNENNANDECETSKWAKKCMKNDEKSERSMCAHVCSWQVNFVFSLLCKIMRSFYFGFSSHHNEFCHLFS